MSTSRPVKNKEEGLLRNAFLAALSPEPIGGGRATLKGKTAVLDDFGACAKSVWAPFASLRRRRRVWDDLPLTAGRPTDIMGRWVDVREDRSTEGKK